MSTQLLVNVIAIGPLGVGDSVTVLHGLRSNDFDVAPTLIQPDRATPIVVDPLSVTDTEVTFTNNGSSPAEAVFRFERGLSNEVDAETVGDLYWQGVVAGGGGGGVNAVTATAPITATGFPITDVALTKSTNFITNGGGALDLSNTGVTAASYGNLAAADQSIVPTFTVDAKGRLTAAASGAIKIGGSDAKTYVDTQDAATLASANAFAESLAFGISSKEPAHVATAAVLPSYVATATTLTASVNGAFPLIDGEAIAVPQRVLVKNEAGALAPNNGIYSLTNAGSAGSKWVLTRTADANTASELCGSIIPVETGTQAGTVWIFAANSATFVLGGPSPANDVVWVQLTVGAATTTSLGIVQLAGGLGGTGTTASAPLLDVSSTSVGSGTLPAIRGGTGQTGSGGMGNDGKVLTADGAGGWAIEDIPATNTTLAQTYYVTANGSDTIGLGDGSIAKPFATIQWAHDVAAATYIGGEFVQIIVGPGTYSAALSISRLNTFIVGSGPRPEDQGTKIQTAVTISPTGGSKFNNQIAIDGCYVTSSTNAAAITVSGTGAFTLTLTNSYITSTNAGASASAFACSNANVKVVGQNCTLTTQGATSAAVINVSAGDVKFQSGQVQNTAGSTSNLAKLTGTGYLFCDSIIFENNTAVASIDSVGSSPAAYKLLVSNSSITSLLAAAGIVANAPSTTSIVTGVVFTVPAGFPIISAPSATGVVVYGNLTSTPTYSVSITGSGATPYSENHGRLYLPSLGDGVLVKGTASAAVSVVAAGGTDGNVLTASGGTWISAPPSSSTLGLVPVPAGTVATFTNGKAVAINGGGALALASATNLSAAPAVGLYVTGGYIRVAGEFTGLTGPLVPGTQYYLDTVAGGLTATPPSTSGNVVQYIGRATSATSLFISPATIVIA